ncbi:MAG: hypothetical protein HQL37_08940 [Alphaproteobacteria bacterium]|nr:hypothetical protein [Alphaproteobacteria bacterium]
MVAAIGRAMFETGDVMRATQTSVDAMSEHFAGLAEKGMGPVDRAARSLKTTWDDLLDSMAKEWKNPSLEEQLTSLKSMQHEMGDLPKLLLGDVGRDIDREGKDTIAQLERAKAAMSKPDQRREMQDLSIEETHSMETYDYNQQLADEKRKTEQLAPALRAEAAARYKALHDNTLSGGYADLNQDLAAREARDTRETTARDAAQQAELQTAAQNRLTEAAGKGSVAMMEAARTNALAAFAFLHTGEVTNTTSAAVKRYAEALKGTDTAKLAAERNEWVSTLDREATANNALAAAWRSGDPAAIRRAEAARQAVEENRKFGISVEDATKALVGQKNMLDKTEVSRLTSDLDRHAAAEDRLAAVAGKGVVAQMEVARTNAVAQFSFQHAGIGADEYSAALRRVDAAKMASERSEWLGTLNREIDVNNNLAAAYRANDKEWIHSADVRLKAEEANRKFGISTGEATTALERQNAAFASIAITKRIADMKALNKENQDILSQKRYDDPAAARQAKIDAEVAKFQAGHPRTIKGTGPDTTDQDIAAARAAYTEQSQIEMQTKAFAAEEQQNFKERHQAAQTQLDDLAKIKDENGDLILSGRTVATMQKKIDEDYRQSQVANLLATKTFTAGAQAAFEEYAHNAADSSKEMQGVVTQGMDKLNEDITGMLTNTKTWKQTVKDMSTTLEQSLMSMAVKQNITGPLAGLLGLGTGGTSGGTSGGGGIGVAGAASGAGGLGGLGSLFGSLFSGSGGSTPSFGAYGPQLPAAAASGAGGRGALGGWFGSLFGGSAGSTPAFGSYGPQLPAAASSSSGMMDNIGDFFSNLFHEGGIIGQGGTSRMANSTWWAGAPRYHDGGIVGLDPDEVPIIARKGERVQTEAQQQASGRTTVRPASVVMHINTPNADSFRQSQNQISAQIYRSIMLAQRNL